jgi:DNA end-binding protein Ku
MRSIFKGVLGFGLISIPVEVYKAIEPESVPLHWVHAACGSRIQYRKVCPVCDVEVEADALVKAAELPDGRLVPLDGDTPPGDERRDRTIGIVSFHDLSDLDPVYYDQAYWLKPGEGGAKAYRLLSDAMEASGKVAVARMTLRRRLSLAVVRPYPTGALLLHSMHYPESLRTAGSHFGEAAAGSVTDRERTMALELIRQLAEPFRPEAYPNEPKAALMARVAERAAAAAMPPGPRPDTAVLDLVAQLQASVEAARSARKGAG